ncbi:MAG: TolC family protein [Deltaproteobacteria bacterium]|nr:TolC family protein [Deltaproteobacteria bacterium]
MQNNTNRNFNKNFNCSLPCAIAVAVLLLPPTQVLLAAELEGPPDTKKTGSTVSLSLDECVEKAIKNSDQIAAERYRLEALDAERKALLWEPFSHFYIQGKFAMVTDKCVDISGGTANPDGVLVKECSSGVKITGDDDISSDDSWGPSFHIKFQGGLPIPTSGKLSYGKTALEEGIKAKKALVPSLQDEIRFNVHRAFHAISGAREMLYTLSEGRKHLQKARTKMEENLENQEGTETEIDLVRLKIFEAQLDAMEQEAILIEKQGLAALNFLVKIPGTKRVDIPDAPQQIVGNELKPLKDYQQQALNHRPELKALQHAVKSWEAQVAFQRTEFIPDLAFVISLRAGRTPGVDVKKDGKDVTSVPFLYENGYNYGSYVPAMALVMTYPLDFGKDINRLKKMKAELSALVLDQKQAIEGIMLEVETVYEELSITHNAIDALNRSKRLARGWMLAAVQNHATGIGTSKDVKDALKEYFGIMAQIHQKIAAYNIAFAKLEKVTGMIAQNDDIN